MPKKIFDNVKLGLFILGGLVFLVLLLYMIGRNRNLFGSTYLLKVKFENAQGLVPGNNVRVSGIEAGTVKKINLLNDTTIEISMLMEKKMRQIIRKNAIVSIGTEGLVGNKVVNITPAKQPAPLAEEGDFLVSKKTVDTYEMLQTLSKTNQDVSLIAEELKSIVHRINSESSLWKLLNDPDIPKDLRVSVNNIRSATGKADDLANNLNMLVEDTRKGKGTIGQLLTDSSFIHNLNLAAYKIQGVANAADSLIGELNIIASGLHEDLNNGKGTVTRLLKDSVTAARLSQSLENIQKGTDGFNQNMEALKHSFLFRGYFKKQEKKKSP